MPPKTREENLADLNRLADEIGGSGASADNKDMSEMRKAFKDATDGFATGLRDIVTMLKGAPPVADQPPGGAPPAGGQPPAAGGQPPPVTQPPAPPADKEPDEDDAGYDDMAKAMPGKEYVDVEGLLTVLETEQRRQKARNAALHREVMAMRKSAERTNALLEAVLNTQVATTAPLMKGLQGIGLALERIPEPSVFGGTPGAAVVGRFAGRPQKVEPTGKLATLDKRGLQKVMLKALNAGQITADDIQRFNATNAFDANPEINATLVARVETQIAS